MRSGPAIDMPMRPWRLSGVVYGALLNHAPALAALGDAANAAPYKAAPKAPVLFVKPRNTLLSAGEPVVAPDEGDGWQVGVSLGIVIGHTACRVAASSASEVIAGYTMVVDFSVPHESFYRPSVRFKARDGSCYVGPRVVSAIDLGDPNALAITVSVDGDPAQQSSTANMIRPVEKLLADVTDFMTLAPGDVLMLGVPHGAPVVRVGQRMRAAIAGVGMFEAVIQPARRREVA
ncbi:MAG: fumarylacetoacetate hydrolase family protein [Burkholderiales bacterium]|nr:fumarylacetoacetate hydrolase family protein [Burkholderiales bacterium]